MTDRSAYVFGGGGVLGFAWTLGAVCALRSEWGVDVERAELLIGTSAGSLLAALLGCGMELDVIRRHQEGVPAPADPTIEWDYATDTGGALPPRPGLRPGSPRLLLDAVRHPLHASAAVALSGLLPQGRGSLAAVHDVVASASVQGLPGRNWPLRPRVWICATDYDSGTRVVFGRDGVRTVLADAVTASCAIPAWFSPVEIEGRRYIDGGTVSNASADLVLPLVEQGEIADVYVLAPMAAEVVDRPRSPMMRLERVVRRSVTHGLLADVDRLRSAGARVTVLTPGPLDLEMMGANLMNPRVRRQVLETSLLTSAAALRTLRIHHDVAAAEAAAPAASDEHDSEGTG